ncbi:hypothetical protein AGABI1DRAFT_132707 [Agaricus bisporus var. burnettii JB137-S8]|uniref:Sm domain-containing protein n=2 Tax=Agaricus bisporus var. burnettii TaxID=192524 RepID=K5WI25_AGABU|nr:hypothetical protein AGABI2DRAFT_123228 [Agaricus bisporus var. bisporus H97]XP_007334403.1 uncharacterized protein AGABI1DRAFT_132707 [Agaricus bisporus var. burnettii JB137-S8]EKM74931.1 hypothetical protein AGABI1DRAFT_132707 [Agaricus bisporus var. burnettii JB137-S8]EKV42108.1 hypothetical protein AGABI2DRAFT_123228 [Agaricus bisporus var. bisporus H97]KAF7782174.1 hypothetical protein Agabi119p4_1550 [Agaricus bisporus var. burnettii]
MSSSAIAKLNSLLCQPIRISTTDNRILIGTFAGTDKPLNIIITNAEEYRIDGSEQLPQGRYVSLVMVPWKLIASIEAPGRWFDTSASSSSMYI